MRNVIPSESNAAGIRQISIHICVISMPSKGTKAESPNLFGILVWDFCFLLLSMNFCAEV